MNFLSFIRCPRNELAPPKLTCNFFSSFPNSFGVNVLLQNRVLPIPNEQRNKMQNRKHFNTFIKIVAISNTTQPILHVFIYIVLKCRSK